MRLIGMLDSPYVRRVAVSMRLLDLPFQHQALSVFRDFETFRGINPLVKVPTLVTDDGVILVDSSIILDHIAGLAPPGRSLMPIDSAPLLLAHRLLGVSLAAMDKSVSLTYERTQRPARLQHPGWIERNRLQLQSALEILEHAVGGISGWLFGNRPLQPDVTIAVAWGFIRRRVSEDIRPNAYPALDAYAQRAERNPAFVRYPFPVD